MTFNGLSAVELWSKRLKNMIKRQYLYYKSLYLSKICHNTLIPRGKSVRSSTLSAHFILRHKTHKRKSKHPDNCVTDVIAVVINATTTRQLQTRSGTTNICEIILIDQEYAYSDLLFTLSYIVYFLYTQQHYSLPGSKL